MGRIADALRRAEQERGKATERLPGPGDLTSTLLEESLRPDSIVTPPAEADPKNTPAEPTTLVQGLSESLVPFFERSSLVTEQYRSLRTRLLSQNTNYDHQTVAITSAVPKEGKSVTALNLGCTLAEIRHLRILVVDADFRRSSLATMLNQRESDQPGLANVLRGEATISESLRKTPISNLTFMGAGKTGQQSAAELLTSVRTSQVMKQLQHDFHYTIVDTPPATTVPDVGIIGQFCSGVVMVVRLHRTNEIVAKRAVRLLQANNISLIGCLLIGRDAPTSRYGYGYGYGYGYRYNYYRYYDYYSKAPKNE